MTDPEIEIEPPNIASKHNSSNFIPDDPTEYTDLADIIRCPVTKIKVGDYNYCSRKSKRKCKFSCSVCNKNCNENQQSIFCSQCTNLVHRKCNGTSKAEFDILSKEEDDLPFFCIVCIIQNNADIFSFGYLSKSEMQNLFGIDMSSQLAMLPYYAVRSKLTKLPHLGEFDINENLVHSINSKYFEISQLNNFKMSTDTMSLFHMNIRSLSAHHDELSLLLAGLKFKFDVIGISETKEQSDKGFLSNVHLSGYNIPTQPTKSSVGGVALYVNSSLNYKTKEHLGVTKDDFEMVCVELLSQEEKNHLYCCVYRHPNTDVQEFLNFIDNLLLIICCKKLPRKKVCFLMGDFSLNLLNYETHSDTNDFLNSAISYSLLPYILHPTRVTEHFATVTDNIFSNITVCESTSGKILSQISDHFPQFLSLQRNVL